MPLRICFLFPGRKVSVSLLRRFFSTSIHWERSGGTSDDNERYCTKYCGTCEKSLEDCVCGDKQVLARYQGADAIPPTKHGEKMKSKGVQGKRTDIDTAWRMIEAGSTEYDIARTMPTTYARYHNGIRRYQAMASSKISIANKRDIKVYVLYGEPGTGKSLWCREFCEANKWSVFDNIDENNAGKISFESYDGEVGLSLQATALIFSSDCFCFDCFLSGRALHRRVRAVQADAFGAEEDHGRVPVYAPRSRCVEDVEGMLRALHVADASEGVVHGPERPAEHGGLQGVCSAMHSDLALWLPGQLFFFQRNFLRFILTEFSP